MLALLSPAKKLDLDSPLVTAVATTPAFEAHTRELIPVVKALSAADLASMMDLSDDLATLNHDRFQVLAAAGATARPAALTFAGEVYQAMAAHQWPEADLLWAQDHLRILSGLYGMLRPLDRIEPYRLEMGTPLKNPRGKDLYAFWRSTLTPALREAVSGHADPTIINLASEEYSKAVDLKRLGLRVITPVFQDVKDGKARVLFLFAKRARGWMARFLVERRAESPEVLQAFDMGGYRFDPDATSGDTWVFRRPQPPPPSRGA